jgi:DNA-binding NtrC family response regulator
MPLLLQTKLLRVIQERMVAPLGSDIDFPVNVRIIAATNQNLEDRVTQNLFRSDLYYRLKVVTIELPSLSERKEDIPLIAMFYIKKFNEKFKKKISGIHPAALQYLQSKIWNGNVRELENELERAVLLCNREFLSIEDFSVDADNSSGSIFRNLPLEWQDFKVYKQRISDELDKRYIKQLLFESGNNIMSASKLGNLERMQIYRLMKKNDEN